MIMGMLQHFKWPTKYAQLHVVGTKKCSPMPLLGAALQDCDCSHIESPSPDAQRLCNIHDQGPKGCVGSLNARQVQPCRLLIICNNHRAVALMSDFGPVAICMLSSEVDQLSLGSGFYTDNLTLSVSTPSHVVLRNRHDEVSGSRFGFDGGYRDNVGRIIGIHGAQPDEDIVCRGYNFILQ